MRPKPRVEHSFDVEAVVRPSIGDAEALATKLGEAPIHCARELREESRVPLVTPRPLQVILFLEVLWSGFPCSAKSRARERARNRGHYGRSRSRARGGAMRPSKSGSLRPVALARSRPVALARSVPPRRAMASCY